MKLEPKPVIAETTKEIEKLNNEIEKLQQKSKIKTLNKINDAQNKMNNEVERRQELESLLEKHPDGLYLSGALLMFCGKKLIIYTVHHLMIIVISYQTIICNLR